MPPLSMSDAAWSMAFWLRLMRFAVELSDATIDAFWPGVLPQAVNKRQKVTVTLIILPSYPSSLDPRCADGWPTSNRPIALRWRSPSSSRQLFQRGLFEELRAIVRDSIDCCKDTLVDSHIHSLLFTGKCHTDHRDCDRTLL